MAFRREIEDSTETPDEFGFVFKKDFDPTLARRFLGLGGVSAPKIPRHQIERIATMLYRHGYITEEEIGGLGMKLVPIDKSQND